jgi:[protein]-arginine 3-hydroxylase / protease
MFWSGSFAYPMRTRPAPPTARSVDYSPKARSLTPSAIQSVEQIAQSLPEDFKQRYVQPGRPVVIQGLARDWPAVRNWNPEYLTARSGATTFRAALAVQSSVDYRLRGLRYAPVEMGTFLEQMRSDESTPYLSTDFAQLPASLRTDVEMPPPCRNAAWTRCKLWIGAAGMVAPLHRESPHNLYAQLHGRKRFFLVAPADSRRVYPQWKSLFILGGVDAEHPDLARFPRFARAVVLSCDLDPGDVLFIPSWWWHQTRGYGLSIAVNFFWADGMLAWKIRATDYGKKLAHFSS